MSLPGNDALIVPANFIERACQRLFQKLRADAEDWANLAGPICRFPWTHCVDQPTPEQLRQHLTDLNKLITFGELLQSATSAPVFPDKNLAAIVTATQGMLRDTHALRHGHQLCSAEASEILQKCFPE